MPNQDTQMILRQELKRPSSADKAALLIDRARRRDPFQMAAALAERGIGFTCLEDNDFPSRLRDIPNRPYGLFCLGQLPDENTPAVAIIGARSCSGYGREQARVFAQKLALRGVNVISGMARGVDGIAGRAAAEAAVWTPAASEDALEAGRNTGSPSPVGRSFAVLGGGVDVIYPKENRELYQMLVRDGGVLSETPPGTQPRAPLFPRRNRLISGLADIVLVIEARQKSGTFITVDCALEQGREIFALPGRVSDALSNGCNHLIKQGAGIACAPEDILESLFGISDEYTDLTNQARAAREQRAASLPPLERALFDALGYGEVMETDYLWHRAEQMLHSHFDLSEIMSAMMQLQIRGMAQEIGISHFRGI